MTAPNPHNRATPQGAPVTAHEADALDAWLESVNTRHAGRRGDPVWSPAPFHAANGTVNAGASLQASAAHAHAMIANAEHESGPDVPTDAIWEKIMASTTAHPLDSGRPAELVSAPAPGRQNHIPAWLSGSHWAVSALMVAAVVVGIVALYGSFAGSPGSPGGDPATNPGIAMASPGDTAIPPDGDIDRWLAPIAPDECDVAETRALEEVGAIVRDPDQIVPREYSPVTEVEAPLARDIAGANRVWEACRAQGLIGERRAVESLRYIAEIEPYNVVSPHNSETFDDWVALNETLRASFLAPDAESYLVESEALPPFDCETGYGETDLSAQVSYEVIQPQHLVQLPDGRIGGPVTSLVGSGFLQCLETRPPAVSSGYQGAYIHILAQDPTREGRWALDERFWVCVSGCDDYYEESAYLYGAYLYPPWPATPEVATPVADAASFQPIYPEECNVEPRSDDEASAIIREPGDEIERSYAPTGPAHDALAQEVAGADRAWQSCYVYGTAGERAALQSPRLTRDGPGPDPRVSLSIEDEMAQLARFDATRELGGAMLSSDWRDYYIESDLFAEGTPAAFQIPDFIPSIPIPEQAFHLSDGRIAIPIAALHAPGYGADQFIDGDDIPYWHIPVHVLAQDPTQAGRWVVDETFTVCMGDCDLARVRIVDYIDYLESLTITPDAATPASASPTAATAPATPSAATPAATDPNAEWLQDPDRIQCTRGDTPFPDFLTVAERPTAIEDYLPFASAAEVERRAVASQHLLIQANCAPNEAGMPAVSDDVSVMTLDGTGSVTQQQLDTAIAISDALALDDPVALVIEGEPLPTSASTGGPMTSSRFVLLPDDVVRLPDGRLGAPLRPFMQTNHPEGVTGWIADRGNRLESLFWIYDERDGVLALDEIIPLCIGDCDDYWNFHRVPPAETPPATPDATPQTFREGRTGRDPASPDQWVRVLR